MKKETKKKTKKVIEKVTLQKLANLIEKLAIFTVNGFEKMGGQIFALQQGQEEIKQEVGEIKHEVGGIKSEVSSVKEEQKDHTRRLISIERKLTGTQISLDETVHRSECISSHRRLPRECGEPDFEPHFLDSLFQGNDDGRLFKY